MLKLALWPLGGSRAMPEWIRFIGRVLKRLAQHRLSLVAAGMAFYAIFSIFPALTAIISVYGLVADPAAVSHQIALLPASVPPALSHMVEQQVRDISQGSGAALSLGLVASVGLAIYSASKSTRALVAALNIAYDESDDRGFARLYLHTLGLTFAGVLLMIGLLALIGLSGYLRIAAIGYWPTLIIGWLRWFVILGLMTGALGMVYGYAPYRQRPRWPWLTVGALLATVLWLLVSLVLSFYIANFGNYNKIYGSAAAIMVLLMWFAASAFVILVGAEINAEIEETADRTPEIQTPLAAMGLRAK